MLTGETVLLTVQETADRRQVSKQAVSRQVASLARRHPEFDQALKRNARGHVVGIPVALFEELIGTFGDQARSPGLGRQHDRRDLSSNTSLDEAKRQTAWIAAERESIRLRETKGSLIRRDRMEDGLAEAGAVIAGIIDRLQHQAEDLAVAADGGPHEMRLKLREISRGMRAEISTALAAAAALAPEEDPVAEDDTPEMRPS